MNFFCRLYGINVKTSNYLRLHIRPLYLIYVGNITAPEIRQIITQTKHIAWQGKWVQKRYEYKYICTKETEYGSRGRPTRQSILVLHYLRQCSTAHTITIKHSHVFHLYVHLICQFIISVQDIDNIKAQTVQDVMIKNWDYICFRIQL